MSKQVSILGCGWLGLPLAEHFIAKGYSVKGSTTSSEKLKVLEDKDISPYQIVLKEDEVQGHFSDFIRGSQILMICIPPGLRRDHNSDFVAKLKNLRPALLKSEIKHLLYVSSTGVFKDHESIPTFTEHHRFSEEKIEHNQLIQAEHLILDLPKIDTSVIRFGGLVGKDRHPVKYLAGRTDLKHPESPVNLIHLDNCIQLISKIISLQKFGHIFHGVEDLAQTKVDYYTQKAEEFGLPLPKFDHTVKSKGKRISMEWTLKELGLELKTRV